MSSRPDFVLAGWFAGRSGPGSRSRRERRLVAASRAAPPERRHRRHGGALAWSALALALLSLPAVAQQKVLQGGVSTSPSLNPGGGAAQPTPAPSQPTDLAMTIDQASIDLYDVVSRELGAYRMIAEEEGRWGRSAPIVQRYLPQCFPSYQQAHALIPAYAQAVAARQAAQANALSNRAAQLLQTATSCAKGTDVFAGNAQQSPGPNANPPNANPPNASPPPALPAPPAAGYDLSKVPPFLLKGLADGTCTASGPGPYPHITCNPVKPNCEKGPPGGYDPSINPACRTAGGTGLGTGTGNGGAHPVGSSWACRACAPDLCFRASAEWTQCRPAGLRAEGQTPSPLPFEQGAVAKEATPQVPAPYSDLSGVGPKLAAECIKEFPDLAKDWRSVEACLLEKAEVPGHLPNLLSGSLEAWGRSNPSYDCWAYAINPKRPGPWIGTRAFGGRATDIPVPSNAALRGLFTSAGWGIPIAIGNPAYIKPPAANEQVAILYAVVDSSGLRYTHAAIWIPSGIYAKMGELGVFRFASLGQMFGGTYGEPVTMFRRRI
jgi:hypothetical protein